MIYILVFNIGIISLTFLMTWVSNHVPDSLIPMVLLHYCFNAGMNLVDTRGLNLGSRIPLLGIMSGLLIIVIFIATLYGGFSTSVEQSKPDRQFGEVF